MIVFLDFESTSVDPMRTTLLEVAAVATGDDLTEHGWFHALIAPTASVLDVRAGCEDVVIDMHDASGLWVALADPLQNPQPFDTVYMMLADWVLNLFGWGEPLTLAGCGVSHFDHQVLTLHMPAVAANLTYFDYDVSVVRRFLHNICGRRDLDLPRSDAHRAMPDVQHGIALARYYRDVLSAVPSAAQA